MNETFSSLYHSALLYIYLSIYICTKEEKCQLCVHGLNVCSRQSNE